MSSNEVVLSYVLWFLVHIACVTCNDAYDYENATELEFFTSKNNPIPESDEKDDEDAEDQISLGDYATVCYSCIGAPPLYTSFNHSALFEYFKTKQISIPDLSIECRDKTPLDAATFDGVRIYMCDSGLCAKLKGTFAGEDKRRVKKIRSAIFGAFRSAIRGPRMLGKALASEVYSQFTEYAGIYATGLEKRSVR